MMCDVRKGTSTRKPRPVSQLVAQQVTQQFASPLQPKKEKKERTDKERSDKEPTLKKNSHKKMRYLIPVQMFTQLVRVSCMSKSYFKLQKSLGSRPIAKCWNCKCCIMEDLKKAIQLDKNLSCHCSAVVSSQPQTWRPETVGASMDVKVRALAKHSNMQEGGTLVHTQHHDHITNGTKCPREHFLNQLAYSSILAIA
ncbi:YY1-associated factor 2 isoform X2 [Alosa sapidissima]|nr:YY1-associated factor 2 isoform X2 [Alosa sapidissima]XP_041934681.1 YY1-associated factor 2 isoform X2 [Alosa sapidissima]